jgi:hypothetical protein
MTNSALQFIISVFECNHNIIKMAYFLKFNYCWNKKYRTVSQKSLFQWYDALLGIVSKIKSMSFILL